MIAALMMLVQDAPAVSDGPALRAGAPHRTPSSVYIAVTDQLFYLFRGGYHRMLESFDDDVHMVVIDPTSGDREAVGKKAVSRTYQTLLPLRGGNAAYQYNCDGGVGVNTCRVSWRRVDDERRFVIRYGLNRGLITDIVVRETRGRLSPIAGFAATEGAVRG